MYVLVALSADENIVGAVETLEEAYRGALKNDVADAVFVKVIPSNQGYVPLAWSGCGERSVIPVSERVVRRTVRLSRVGLIVKHIWRTLRLSPKRRR